MEFLLTLRRRGIADQAVLRAMDEVPREFFVETAFAGRAYADQALPIACGQTISQPYVVAYMTEQLNVGPTHRVLEIGTGSGYQAAVLSRLAREVVTIERYRTLADQARERLKALGYDNVEIVSGDGFAGMPERAPFDRIIVTAAAETIPGNTHGPACRRRHHDPATRLARGISTHYQAYQVANGNSAGKPHSGAFCANASRAGTGIVVVRARRAVDHRDIFVRSNFIGSSSLILKRLFTRGWFIRTLHFLCTSE